MEPLNSLTLPPEIWLRVADFIAPEDIKRLIGVNLMFYNLGMDFMYSEVTLETRDTRPTLKTIFRLANPPAAKRLRKLVLRLTHVKLPASQSTHALGDPRQLRKQIHDRLNRVFKPFGKYLGEGHTRDPSSISKDLQKATFYDVMNELIAILPRFVSVREFAVESWDLPPTYNLGPLYTSIWQSFGPRLHTFQFGGNLEGYRTFIQSRPVVTDLKTLRLEIINDIFRSDLPADHLILSDLVIPFINNLRPQLRALSLWAWANVNLSRFFDLLGPEFPFLESFKIRANFNIVFPDGGPTLHRFLSTSCPALKEVELRLKPTGIIAQPHLEDALADWLRRGLEDPTFFANITHLDIYPTSLPPGMGCIRQCVTRTSPHLVSFTVRDRYWTFDEVKAIIEMLSGCPALRSVRFSTGTLTVALLDLLAEKIPHIRSLWLSIGYNVNETKDGNPTHFQEIVKTRSYTQLQVEVLTLWQGGQEVDHTTMCAIAQAMPAVWSFFGRGHMRPVPQ